MDKLTPVCSRLSLVLLFLWVMVFYESLLLKTKVLFWPICHCSNKQVTGLGETLVGIRSLITIHVSFRKCPLCTLRGTDFENHGELMTTAKERREKGAGRALEVSITNRAPYPSCQISTKALWTASVQCLQTTSQGLTSFFFIYITNIHTYMCVCVFTAMRRKGCQEPNASSKHWENQQKRTGLPYVHCYNSISNAWCRKRLSMVTS